MCVGAEGWWGAGVRESTRRKERGPGGEQREEPIPRVLALLLDSMFYTITSWYPCCLRHTAVEQHSSWKMGKWAPGRCHLLLTRVFRTFVSLHNFLDGLCDRPLMRLAEQVNMGGLISVLCTESCPNI